MNRCCRETTSTSLNSNSTVLLDETSRIVHRISRGSGLSGRYRTEYPERARLSHAASRMPIGLQGCRTRATARLMLASRALLFPFETDRAASVASATLTRAIWGQRRLAPVTEPTEADTPTRHGLAAYDERESETSSREITCATPCASPGLASASSPETVITVMPAGCGRGGRGGRGSRWLRRTGC